MEIPTEKSKLLKEKPSPPSTAATTFSSKFGSVAAKVTTGAVITTGILGAVALLNKAGYVPSASSK